MNYESRVHRKRSVSSTLEAARIFKEGTYNGCEALILDDRYAFVDDQNPHGTGALEIAVIDIKDDKKIESITASWINEIETLADYFDEAINGDFFICHGANLSFSNEDINQKKVWLICGCCGTGFQDYHKNQVKYDQDTGFGICGECNHFYE